MLRKSIARLTVAWLAILLSIFQVAYAQRTITGTVTDQSGAGLAGVTVTVKGTRTVTTTDASGSFTINAPDNATLVFTSVGYSPTEIPVRGQASVTATLTSQESNLNEVVVIGYGTARRRDLTGSVASVRAKDFNKGVITAPDQLIQGKVAGVLMINNSGQPGGATTVRIRGNASIRSGNNPLYVVDGVPLPNVSARPNFSGGGIGSTPGTNPLNFINPYDIASMEVMKDASATAIYGSRGANGVILITTKKGATGQPRIEFNAGTGISRMMKRLDVLSGDEYRSALKQYNLTSGDFGESADALGEVTRTGYVQNYNVGVSGGGENGRYRFSAGYLNEQGIVKESDFKKYVGSFISSYRFLESKKLGLDVNLIASHINENLPPISNDAGFTGSLIGQALQWNPTHGLRRNGRAWIDPAVGATTVNPVAMLEAWDDRSRTSSILATIIPSFRITKDLEYRFQYSLLRGFGTRNTMVDTFININQIQGRGIAAYANVENNFQQFTNTLNYTRDLSSAFSLNATVGYEYLKSNARGVGLSAQDFINVGLNYTDFLQYSSQPSRSIGSFSSPNEELQSFFGRGIFNLRDRYILTATLRVDGSSKFGENNKYGFFPSFAGAWYISKEDFMGGNPTFSNLKLRAGWGQTGNQEFPPGASLRRYAFGQQSLTQVNFESPDLKWETSTTANVGVDFGLWNDRIFGSIEYFNRKTQDVLFEQNVIQPGPSGPKFWINLPGEIVNKGWEVTLNSDILRSRDVLLNLGIFASFLQNELTGFGNRVYETGGLHGQGISGTTIQRLVDGQPLNVFYLRRYQGIDKTSGQAIYEDDGNTLYYSGSPNPKTLLGISTNFSYKNWSANINMNGAFGHYIYNNTANTVLPIGNLGTRNITKSLLGGSAQESIANPIAASTRYLEKGNYMKMANATLSYNLGNLGTNFRNVNVSLTGQNLFVITKFTGFDPEVNTDKSVGGIPSFGIEYTPYPSARKILLGINFQL